MKEDAERNKEIIQLYTKHAWNQPRIAEHFGISQQRVSQIIQAYRIAQGPINKGEVIAQAADILDHLASMAVEVANTTPPPVTAGKDGVVVRDPETGNVVRDHSGRLQAMQTAKALLERKSRLLGLDSATKVETTGSVTYKIEGVDPDAL